MTSPVNNNQAPERAPNEFAMNSGGSIAAATIALLKSYGLKMEMIHSFLEAAQSEVDAFSKAKAIAADAARDAGVDEANKLMFSGISSAIQGGMSVAQGLGGYFGTSGARADLKTAEGNLRTANEFETTLSEAARTGNPNHALGGDAVAAANPNVNELKYGQLKEPLRDRLDVDNNRWGDRPDPLAEAVQHLGPTDGAQFQAARENANARIRDRTNDVKNAHDTITTTQGYINTVKDVVNGASSSTFQGFLSSNAEKDKADANRAQGLADATSQNAEKAASALTDKMASFYRDAQDLQILKDMVAANRAV